VPPFGLITYASDAPTSYSSEANARRRVWFVTPLEIDGRPLSAASRSRP